MGFVNGTKTAIPTILITIPQIAQISRVIHDSANTSSLNSVSLRECVPIRDYIWPTGLEERATHDVAA